MDVTFIEMGFPIKRVFLIKKIKQMLLVDKFILFLSFGAGLFCIVASAFNWEFFFQNKRAQFFVKLFGRTGARIFYALLGLFLLYVGVTMYKDL
jgi:small neutral amino acid transporter SnatA (MarC family)